MSLSSQLARADRHPFLAGSITYLTGQTLPFTGRDALAFTLSEGPSGGQMLGGAFSAACSLTLHDPDGYFTLGRSPYGAQVTVRLGEGNESAPLAVFTVSRVGRREEDSRLTLSGQDALGAAFDGALEDAFVYPLSLLEIARGVAAQAGFTLQTADFPNAAFVIPQRPDWGEISLRQALAHIACAAGCFSCIDREGRLIFKPLNPAALPFEISPAMTLSYENGEKAFGPLSVITVSPKGGRRGEAPLVIGETGAVPSPANALSISGNPLFPAAGAHTQALAQGLFEALRGYAVHESKITWRGSPLLTLGDRVRILDTEGRAVETAVTSQHVTFQQGFSMRTGSAFPASPAAVGRLFTPAGALNAAALEGSLNGAIIRDGSIAASSLISGSVTALQLSAGAVTAEKLSAGAVTADKLAASAVTADKLSAQSVTADKLAAGVADALLARFAQADIDWAHIESLQSAVAQIAQACVNTADVDWARIKDLVSHRAVITQGEAGEFYIARLSVTEANLLSLTVGEILVRGADGGLYALTVDGGGAVSAQRKQIVNADVQDASIFGDEKLVEGSVTARALNAREIFGENALIRRLIADTLDVDALFAREAVIRRLNALDITGNESIRLYVQNQEQMSAYLRLTADGLEIGRAGDSARFRADNRTLEVTNITAERLGVAQAMGLPEEWAFLATRTGLGLKYLG